MNADEKKSISRAAPTAYAIEKDAFTHSQYRTEDGEAAGWWWLRSPGSSQNNVAFVDTDGSLACDTADYTDFIVRPAFWLDVSEPVPEVGKTTGNKSTFDAVSGKAAMNGKGTPTLTKQNYSVGSCVFYGNYPQTNVGNDMTHVEWQVLEYDARNNRALLISRYGLDCKKYNDREADVTWETCSLRAWLNGAFLKKAFNKAEQAAILTVNVDNGRSQCRSGWDVHGGRNTQDKVFLLSYAEVNRYFKVQHNNVSEADRNMQFRVAPTAYARSQGAYVNSNYKTADGEGTAYWWLRSPGHAQHYAVYVRTDGSLFNCNVNDYDLSVRPAFWLDLSKK